MYENATNLCEQYAGFHYMVHITDIAAEQSDGYEGGKDYPCIEQTKIRCQDGTLLNFDTGIGFCFIGQSQLEETLNE